MPLLHSLFAQASGDPQSAGVAQGTHPVGLQICPFAPQSSTLPGSHTPLWHMGSSVWTSPLHRVVLLVKHWTSVMQATQCPAPSQSVPPPPSVHGFLTAAGAKPHVLSLQMRVSHSFGGAGHSLDVVHVIPPELLDVPELLDADDAELLDVVDVALLDVDAVEEPSPPEPSGSVCGVGPGQAAMVTAKPPKSATASPVWTWSARRG